MEPPWPRQMPVFLPNSSAMISRAGTPYHQHQKLETGCDGPLQAADCQDHTDGICLAQQFNIGVCRLD